MSLACECRGALPLLLQSGWVGPTLAWTSFEGLQRCDGTRLFQPDIFKALLRSSAARTIREVWAAVGQSFTRFTPQECRNYLAAAGYEDDLSVATRTGTTLETQKWHSQAEPVGAEAVG